MFILGSNDLIKFNHVKQRNCISVESRRTIFSFLLLQFFMLGKVCIGRQAGLLLASCYVPLKDTTKGHEDTFSVCRRHSVNSFLHVFLCSAPNEDAHLHDSRFVVTVRQLRPQTRLESCTFVENGQVVDVRVGAVVPARLA